MDEHDLWRWSIAEAAEALRTEAVSSTQLTRLMLERIARFDPMLHSFQAVAAEAALATAAVLDQEAAAGRWRGPLHGIPFAIKDAFFTTRIPTGLGSPVFDAWQAPYDSTATARLEEAGAVLLGKLTLTEGVYADHHPTTVPPVNPFGPAHWTGTSSSGSGVAVTAGLCYGALGTDTGGSIRLPSACCGLTGIKPTWGRVSRHGVFPLAESLDHVGPMARTARDAALMLQAIAGQDPNDPTASPASVPDYVGLIEGGVADLTVGIDWGAIEARADAEVVASLRAVAVIVEGLGARLVDVRMPPSDAILTGWAVQCAVEAAIAHRPFYPSRRDEYGARFAALLERGRAFSGEALAEALAERRLYTGRMAQLFDGIDLLLVPALPVAGPTLDFMASLGEDPAGILAIGPFTAPFDVCGYPTITLPCGESGSGIPIGFQFAAKPFAEELLCRAAHAYQGTTGWHLRRPDLDSLPPVSAGG